jgi:serine/threonine protein kinase
MLGRFRILDVLSVGGVGTVYSAHDPTLDRTVALKVLSGRGAEDPRRHRWHREAQAMALVSHPNVVPFVDVGMEDGHVFIAMELVAGGDLDRVLRRRRLSVAEIIEVFAGIARGLQAVHDAGLLHLDFKPQHVLIAPDTQPLLTDFGLAQPQPGRLMGTPRYRSPEQIAKRPLSVASDQFSFGVALYEALFSRHPFVHTDVASLHAAVLEGRVVIPEDRRVPRHVRAAVLRCLQPDPADRFDSMKDVAEVLETSGRSSAHIVAMALCAAAGLAAAAFIA